MNIHIAVKYVQQGYKIKRSFWREGESIWLADGISLNKTSFYIKKVKIWIPNLEDLLADDWEIVSE